LALIDRIVAYFDNQDNEAGRAEASRSRRIARWCWDQINNQPPDADPEVVPVPMQLRRTKAVLARSKRACKAGRRAVDRVFHALMRKDPVGTIRNVARDLEELVTRSAAGTAYVSCGQILYHVKVAIPQHKRIIVLDATANAELLAPIFAPKRVEVVCGERVQPAGRVIQFMDFNGPRSYLNKIPAKLTSILNAIGDVHPVGPIVLISHKPCVDKLREASRHAGRIVTAHFGALRGRNDLEFGRPRARAYLGDPPKGVR
jgi:hypothetical protein